MKYFVKVILSTLTVLLILILSYTAEGQSTQENKDQLEGRVSEYLKESNVDLREHVDDFFSLADIYVDEGSDGEAIRLYQKALSVDAWRLEYQLKLAHLLNNNGAKSQAIEKAKMVHQYAEDENLIENSQKFLSDIGIEFANDKTAGASSIVENVEIVIVPIGKVNRKLLREVKEGLQEAMGIKYSISKKELELGKIDRSFVDKYLTEIVDRIESQLTKEQMNELLSELNLNKTVLEARDPKIKFIDAFFGKIGLSQEEIRKFHDEVEKVQKHGQHDAARLRLNIERSFEIEGKSKIKGYLGITEGDIFTKDYNFLYGWGRAGYAVMSYHRFRAVFNMEPPNRPRLHGRTVKQGISSSFFILGIPRCSTPTCARAYPHRLTEHDQKDIKMCSQCKKQLSSYIEKNN